MMTDNPAAMSADALRAEVQFLPIDDLRPNPRNSRKHGPDQVSAVAAAMREFGWTIPILADLDDGGIIVAGHGRRMSAKEIYSDPDARIRWLGGPEMGHGIVPVLDCSEWSEEQRRLYTIADNRLAEKSEWDLDNLVLELSELEVTTADDADLASIGFTAAEIGELIPGLDDRDLTVVTDDGTTLYDRFMIPPMTVLDARMGWWMKRKRAWISLGLRSEIGRGTDVDGVDHGGGAFGQDLMRGEGPGRKKKTGGVLYQSPTAADTDFYRQKKPGREKNRSVINY